MQQQRAFLFVFIFSLEQLQTDRGCYEHYRSAHEERLHWCDQRNQRTHTWMG